MKTHVIYRELSQRCVYGRSVPGYLRTGPGQLVPRTTRTQDDSYLRQLGTTCPGYDLSLVRLVMSKSCLGYEFFWVRVVHKPLRTQCWLYQPYGSGIILTSWSGNAFRVTGPLWGESIGHRWIPLIKGQQCGLWYFLWCLPEFSIEKSLIVGD